MRRLLAHSALLTILCLSMAAPAQAQSPEDLAAIEQTALDYIQGYYSGSPERLERALHPELAKRIVRVGEDGEPVLENMTAQMLIEIAGRMSQRPVPEEEWVDDVKILDVFKNTAAVRIDASQWIDYLHLARWQGEWKIVNVLWEMHSGG